MDLHQILKAAYEADASDIHLISGQPPVIRVHQVMTPMDFPIITPDSAMATFKLMAPKESQEVFDRVKDADFSYEVDGLARYRVNAHMQKGMVGLALRMIKTDVPSADGPESPRGDRPADVPAPRPGARDGRHRFRQVDDARRHDPGDERALSQAHHHARGSGRVHVRLGEVRDRAARASGRTCRRSPRASSTPFARTPTSSWSARCATWRRRPWRSRPPRQATSCSRPCTRSTPRRRWSASSDMYPAGQQNQIRSMLSNTLQAVVSQTLFSRHRRARHGPGRRDAALHARRPAT